MINSVVGHYKIIEKLGEGGMGVVFKAEDIKLKRVVALKFLPQHTSASEADKARFMQEAQAAAALNHPNICTIYGIDEHEGQMFIAMEFVDGQTLREKRGTISFKQGIDIGIQIADGLAAAHENGIVHRDVKPENIMVRKDGIAQIMDFGLAKLRTASSKINRLTKEGSTIGTAGYMSPEQIQGLDADHRSDIFSYGVLLFELLTGQLPFKGVHETALAYEIVNVDAPPMSSIVTDIDPALDAIVLDCLEKDPNERTQSVKQVSVDLKRYKRESSRQRASRITAVRPAMRPSATSQSTISTTNMAPPRQSYLPWLIAAVFFLGTILFAFLYVRSPRAELQTVRSTLLPPEMLTFAAASGTAGEGHLALSPDGSMLAFVATDSSGRTHLMIRSLSTSTSKELSATGEAYYPFWSPDNRFIAFFQNGKLKKMEVVGGPSQTLCDAPDARGGSWNQAGVLIFAPSPADPLYQVPASGGSPTTVTHLDSSLHQRSHRWPSFLPDGKHFIYFGRSSFGGVEREEDGLFVGTLDGKESKRLPVGKANAQYASGYLLYVREKTLMAQPFDPDKLELSGEATPIAEPIEFDLNYNRAVYTASGNGIVAYQTSKGQSGLQLVWFDRKGASLGTVGEPADYGSAQLSPDGKTLACDVYDSQSRNRDIWLFDISRKIKTRFTFDASVDEYPVWSPDGKRITFHSDRRGHYDLYEKTASGAGADALLFESASQKFPTSWSSDGRFLLFSSVDPNSGYYLSILPVEQNGDAQERKAFPFFRSQFSVQYGAFSPDMRWISYVSNESGTNELYIRPFHDPRGAPSGNQEGKWQVSANGVDPNAYSHWSRDGKQLYYQSIDGKLFSVEITAQGSTLSVGNAVQLFALNLKGTVLFQDVTADGQRFLFISSVGGASTEPVSLITNWDAQLKKK